MASPSCAVLVSGGIESSILTAEALGTYASVTPVYIRQGLKWESTELTWIARYLSAIEAPAILRPLKIIDLPLGDVYDSHWSISKAPVPSAEAPHDADFLPGRNMILLAKTVIYCSRAGIETILHGTLRTNPHPDSTPEFFKAFSKTAALALGTKFNILTPFSTLTKKEVLRRGRRWPLELTFSCIAPIDEVHCGACIKCAERQQAFQAAQIPDPTTYREVQNLGV